MINLDILCALYQYDIKTMRTFLPDNIPYIKELDERDFHTHYVFKIKELFQCTRDALGRQNHAPGYHLMCTFLYVGIHNLEYTCTCRVNRV